MKRIIVFLLLAALLLGGCGTRTPEAETSRNTERKCRRAEHGNSRLVGAERGGRRLLFSARPRRRIMSRPATIPASTA